MSHPNKRDFLKMIGLAIGSLLAGTTFKRTTRSTSTHEVQAVYRVDFPEHHTDHLYKQNSHRLFDKSLDKQIIREIGCEGLIKKEVVKTARYMQKTLTFPSEKHLDLYVQKVREYNLVKSHSLLASNGYKVSVKKLV